MAAEEAATVNEALLGARSDQTGDVLLWGLILIAAIAVLGVGVLLLRRWTIQKSRPRPSEEWSLQQLRDWRDRGEISEDEFATLKRKMIADAAAAANRDDDTVQSPKTHERE